MKIRWNRWNRKVHYWLSLVIALPILVVIASGVLLQLKKDWAWVQPPTREGSGGGPRLGFDEILQAAMEVEQTGFAGWGDIDRMDVRPGKGVVKVRGKNRWEVQVDWTSGEVLQVAYRRSDLIESIHDGSYFHGRVKLGVFLPAAICLLVMWGTGIWLFLLPFWARRRR